MENKRIIRLLVFVVFTVQVAQGYANILAGNAILLDGIDDFISIPDASQLGGMSGLTVEAWFMPSDISRNNPLFYKSDGIATMTDRSYELALAPHTPSWAVFTGSNGWTWLYGSTPPPITVGQWTHIAANYDSTAGIASIYFNGNLFSTTTIDASGYPISGLIRDSRENLILGALLANAYHGAEYSFGVMDEVRMWNYARNESQIAQNFNRLVNPAEEGLIGYWNFDENLDNQYILDSSSFGTNGSLGASLGVEYGDPSRVISTAPIVPEPATILLLGLGGIVVRTRCKGTK